MIVIDVAVVLSCCIHCPLAGKVEVAALSVAVAGGAHVVVEVSHLYLALKRLSSRTRTAKRT